MASPARLLNVGTWIEGGVSSFNVATLFEPGQLGQVFESAGNIYQVVQLASTSAAVVAGTPVIWSVFNTYVVSATIADGLRNSPAGISAGTITAGNYGIIQVGGPNAVAVSDSGSYTAGAMMIMSATNGQLTGIAAGTAPTYVPMGILTVTTSATPVTLQITVPLNI